MGQEAGRDRLRELLDAVVAADNSAVGDMARSTFASEFHFSRQIRRLTGESPPRCGAASCWNARRGASTGVNP